MFKTLAILSIAVLGGCSALIETRASTREADALRDWPPLGQFVDVGGGRQVHAFVTGQGPDLVLIHGASGNLRDFTFDFVDRVRNNYRVIVFDRPGLGYTDRVGDSFGGAFNTSAESPEQQAAMLWSAADRLSVTNPIVLGHSYGGSVAMAWGLNHPASALVIVSGATMPWPGKLGPSYTVLGSGLGGAVVPPFVTAFASQETINDAVRSVFAPNAAPDGYAQYVGPGLTLRRESLRANARQVNSLRPHLVQMSARYPSLDLPIELIHGDADTTVPIDVHARPLDALLPNSALNVLPGVGHMPHHVQPQTVVDAINRAAHRAGLRQEL
ncbi:alpha/beta fold hydrolase [Puniceibacterium sp. IMCC21224]|uniref:alpha/beta fold hydrolase n=1 Tax=Puniceibacterium sp. IMCC21224 TaxID=1618204 RepID=UPI00064DD1E6|nr:alpha/beta hydrolase [Puniceibacterium sp. IMCC21224]KMK67213.1 putative hydrolase or acyltransferase of alpha/beta superfamily [Puniceibacterium sp. IMCC21224]